MLDIAKTKKLVDQCWADEIVPTLVEYIKIPNKSPSFDSDWAAHGYMEEAVRLFEGSTPVASHPRSYDRHQLVEDPARRRLR